MTKREMNAKINEAQEEMAEMKKHRKPSDKDDNLAIESISVAQSYRESNKTLEVQNSKDTVTVLSEASIKTTPGGYKEVNKKASKRKEVQGRE